ncbi:kinase-like protein [Aspergillus terreus]|uniref:Kinase-like protein n=1 Tax=Aspergillus terreus TaxID=33178 RepID=A0A5M3YXN0_ASPTE|nr:hypothetical protein ATETN484_0005069600 [Aspergillus terreus]GFF17348.1 kinase-like protein [Aspergillus terreus]
MCAAHANSAGETAGEYNEDLRLRERYLEFNVPALQHTIASALGASSVTSFAKVAEGGFNRLFEATCSDGRRVLARLPYPSTVPKHYTTASEVATLEYLRLNGFPVPKVHAWSSTTDNAVGAEYIIMEKLDGTPFGEVWYILDFKQRYKVTEQIVQLERRLFDLQIPANGSIYFPGSLNEHERAQAVPLPNQDGTFCIGPPRLHYERSYRKLHGFKKMHPQAHIHALEKYLQLANCLGYPQGSNLNRPVLRHPDLQPNNILLSDSLDVTAIVDWQHATIMPLCLAASMPKYFQNYGDPESDRMAKPARDLPAGFEGLGPAEQASVRTQHLKRHNRFLYAALTLRHSPEHYDAIFNDGVIRHQRLYVQRGDPVGRRLCHAGSRAYRCDVPPIQYSEESAASIMELYLEQQEMDAVMHDLREMLDVDVSGWVPNEAYAETRELARTIKERCRGGRARKS